MFSKKSTEVGLHQMIKRKVRDANLRLAKHRHLHAWSGPHRQDKLWKLHKHNKAVLLGSLNSHLNHRCIGVLLNQSSKHSKLDASLPKNIKGDQIKEHNKSLR